MMRRHLTFALLLNKELIHSMPNWCLSHIVITNDNKSMENLHEHFNDAIQKNDGDYQKNWLGNLLLYIGEDVDSPDAPRCRGWVDDYSYTASIGKNHNTGYLNIDTSSAWVPMLQVIIKFVNKYSPNADISFCAEEPGCELYWRNDTTWEQYYVEVYEEEATDKIVEWVNESMDGSAVRYMYKDELGYALSKLLGHDGNTDRLITEAMDKYEDYGLRIRQFRLVDLCEVD